MKQNLRDFEQYNLNNYQLVYEKISTVWEDVAYTLDSIILKVFSPKRPNIGGSSCSEESRVKSNRGHSAMRSIFEQVCDGRLVIDIYRRRY